MNRAVAVAVANIEAVNAAHARVIHERKDRRGISFFAAAAVLGAAGFGGAGAGTVVTVAALGAPAGVGSRDSSLLIGISS